MSKPEVPRLRVGMRIRLIRGMSKDIRCPDDRLPYMDALAGRIPVGATGTLYQEGPFGLYQYTVMAVRWDGITPNPGYYFSLGKPEGAPLDTEVYEEISEHKEEGHA